ncbi:MAG: hypothetical protein OEZ39_19805 [Gammaproteobacteria bacterium]|nr:hypothetical protein [Gammaproteobacteria bacterium]MDH5654113.1 hypothetical protein [Gammaproteobacteria bacterium]
MDVLLPNLCLKTKHHNKDVPTWGGLLFGYFLLAAQEKVTRLSRAAAGGINVELYSQRRDF